MKKINVASGDRDTPFQTGIKILWGKTLNINVNDRREEIIQIFLKDRSSPSFLSLLSPIDLVLAE